MIRLCTNSKQRWELKGERDMQQEGVNGTILQKPDLCARKRHKSGSARRYRERRGASSSSTSASIDSLAFLSQKIEAIRTSDEQYLGEYCMDIPKSFTNLQKTCQKFLELSRCQYEVDYSGCNTVADKIIRLTEWFERQVESFGYNLSLHKSYGDECLHFVLYYPLPELEWMICVFYCAPANYLSEKGGELYKKYIKFISDSMGIGIGSENNHENYILDTILTWMDEFNDSIYDDIDEDRLKIVNKYKKGGEFHKLFEEIDKLPFLSSEGFTKELQDYRKVCPNDELELVECMLEGIPVVRKMNVNLYDFIPDYERDDPESELKIALPWTTAILYSCNDGIGDELVDSINSDVQCGSEVSSWIVSLTITEDINANDLKTFGNDKSIGKKFSKWIEKFNKLTEKFDKYEQSQR